jgi:ribosomal protein L13E
MTQAMITHRGQERKARGFSCAEIKAAKMSCAQFDELKLQWDSRRKTNYPENVKTLQALLKKK